MRSRSALAMLLTTACALAAAAPAGAAAPLHGAYDLDGSLDATWSSSPWTTSLTSGPSTFDEVVAGGVPRRVGRYGAGEGYGVSATLLGSAFTAAMTVRLDAPATDQRVLAFYVRGWRTLDLTGGRLRLSGAGDPVTGTHTIGSGWTHIVVTRTAAGAVDVYVDGEHDLAAADPANDTVGGSIRFGNTGAEGLGAGQVARLRVARSALSAAEVAALRPFDAEAPATEVDFPRLVGAARLAGPRSQWHGAVRDDGDAKVAVRVRIEDAQGTVVVPEQLAGPASVSRPDFGFERLWGGWALTPGGTLVDGAAYAAVVRATDRWGHETVTRFPFVADVAAPAATLDALPARVSDHTPSLAGAIGAAPGDAPYVSVDVCPASATCAAGSDGDGPVAGSIAGDDVDAVEGRWRVDDLAAQNEDGEPVELADGDYTAVVRQWDSAGNTAVVRRAFTIGPPLPPDERPDTPERPSSPPSPSSPSSPPSAGPAAMLPASGAPSPAPRAATPATAGSARTIAARLGATIAARLRAKGARALRRPLTLTLTRPPAGTVTVALRDARGAALATGRLSGARLRITPTAKGRGRLGRRGLKLRLQTTYTPTPGAPAATTSTPLNP